MLREGIALGLVLVSGCAWFGSRDDRARDTTPEELASFLDMRRDAGIPPDRPIAPGDLIHVEIAGVEGGSRDYAVSRSGAIRVPSAGETKVGGKTLDEAEQLIASRLTSVIANPEVDVALVELAGGEAVIAGAVARPGAIRLGAEGRTLREALALVGGLTDEASGMIRIRPATSDASGSDVIELAANDVLTEDTDDRVELFLRPGDRIDVVSERGATSSEAPDSLAELGLAVAPRERSAPPERRSAPRVAAETAKPAPPVVAPEPAAPVPAAPVRAAPETVAVQPPRDERAATPPTRMARTSAVEAGGSRGDLEAFRRRAEATEVELRNQLRRAEEEGNRLRREAASARAEAAAAARQLAAEQARSQSLAARIMEIEAGRGGPAIASTHVVARPPSPSVAVRREPPPVEEPVAAEPVAEESAAARAEAEPAREEREEEARDDARETDAPAAPEQIEVSGHVQHEGAQPLAAARTVLRAVMRAQLAPDADVSRIEVRRGDGRERSRMFVNLREVRAGRSPDLVLEDGDSIVVP